MLNCNIHSRCLSSDFQFLKPFYTICLGPLYTKGQSGHCCFVFIKRDCSARGNRTYEYGNWYLNLVLLFANTSLYLTTNSTCFAYLGKVFCVHTPSVDSASRLLILHSWASSSPTPSICILQMLSLWKNSRHGNILVLIWVKDEKNPIYDFCLAYNTSRIPKSDKCEAIWPSLGWGEVGGHEEGERRSQGKLELSRPNRAQLVLSWGGSWEG